MARISEQYRNPVTIQGLRFVRATYQPPRIESKSPMPGSSLPPLCDIIADAKAEVAARQHAGDRFPWLDPTDGPQVNRYHTA